MQKTHFEIAVEKAQAEVKDSLLKLPFDAELALRHAKLVGYFEGLTHALGLHRRASVADGEGDLS